MAIFNRWSLTDKGMALITKAQAGKCTIHFTRLETGNGVWTAEELRSATALKSLKQTFAYSAVRIPAGSTATVTLEAVINNINLDQLYYLRELGVYATDPDEGDILYAIAMAESDTTYIPANNGVGISTIVERINIEVANAESVTIDTTGAVVAAVDFLALKDVFDQIDAGIKGGTKGQHIVKASDADYDFSWGENAVVVASRADFPAPGSPDTAYIDADTSSIYVWNETEAAYQKLALGADAAETLQEQITANKKAIAAVSDRTTTLEAAAFTKTDITVPADGWSAAGEGSTIVYTQEMAVTGLTETTALTVWPHITATTADAIVTEQKAQGVLFGRGKVYADEGRLVLKCYGKRPAADFGITLQGV